MPRLVIPPLFSCFKRGYSAKEHNCRLYDPAATADETTEEQRRGVPCAVLVELFSSQGCKKSSEAEHLMSKLGQGEFTLNCNVIVLIFHVDYWDPFMDSQWTLRQKNYVKGLSLDTTVLTQQVVVQGRVECVGDQEENVLSHIVSTKRFPSPCLEANFQRPTPQTLQVSISGPLMMNIDREGAYVMAAMYENGLTTDCSIGDNQGLVLSNDYVVRRFVKLCSLKDFPGKKRISEIVNFNLWDGFNSTNCGLVIFVQNNSHHIFGSQKFDLPSNL